MEKSIVEVAEMYSLKVYQWAILTNLDFHQLK